MLSFISDKTKYVALPVRKKLRIFLTDDALSSKVPQLTLRIADGDCIVNFQFVEQLDKFEVVELVHQTVFLSAEGIYRKTYMKYPPENEFLAVQVASTGICRKTCM